MTLEPGDLVLTGTPAGVGPVLPGQMIEAGILGEEEDVELLAGLITPKMARNPPHDGVLGILDDIIRDNPEKQPELAMMINRINQVRRASRSALES